MQKLIGLAMSALGLTALVASFAITIAEAAPVGQFSATAPTSYENGAGIDPTDILTYKVYCGTQPGVYDFVYDAPDLTTSGASVDVQTCVQGTPGTYYFVATATSTLYATESVFSNEATRFYTANDLGNVPNAPVLFTVQ